MLRTAYMSSPCGELEIITSAKGLRSIHFVQERYDQSQENSELGQKVINQLAEYFIGQRQIFQLPIDWDGMPPFRREVLKMVCTIPYGKTRTYKQIADVLDKPGASRAVGQANHNNRIPIVIPCHRVIGAKGELIGYANGLDTKRQLLALETPGSYAAQSLLFEQLV